MVKPAYRTSRRPPFFRPVPTRSRRDGWTETRQCLFLAELYLTGTVSTAASRVGMSRMSAYRLRDRPDALSFARAWDHVLSPPGSGRMPAERTDWRKVTQSDLIERVQAGFVQPVIYRGKVTAIRRKPDISALLRLVRRSGAPRFGRGDEVNE